jgi:chromosome segregation ATPase
MILKRIEIRNVRKIKQADIEFHGPGMQVIQGMNESGKSTIAQCIALSLEGTKAFTPGMITQGEEQAEVIAYLDSEQELKIRTIIADSVKQTVSKKEETTGKYAAISGGVRAFLDSLRSGLEMPWAMKEMPDAKVIELLKDRSGLTQKIAGIDAAIRDKEAARTETGRDKKKLGARDPVKPAEHPPGIDNIRAVRDEAVAYLNKERDALLKAADYIRGKCIFGSIGDIEKIKEVVDVTIKSVEDHLKDDNPYTKEDVEALEKEITTWVEKEQKANDYDAYLEWKKQIDQLTADYETLTKEIETLRESRKKALAGMRLGVKGLEIGEDNFLYHNGAVRGITETNKASNWSTAESVKVFFSIGAAFSGELKVLIVDNAESLDENTTKAISDWAETAKFLVILLKVASVPKDLEDGIIYVREGEIITGGKK